MGGYRAGGVRRFDARRRTRTVRVKPLRVLHVLDHSLPLHSGYSFRSASILRAERAQGLQVAAVTSPKHEESWHHPAASIEDVGGVRIYRSGATPPSRLPLLPWPGELRLMDTLRRRIQAAAEIERPDIIHAHSPVLNALPALSVGKRLGIPVVYEIRAFWEDAAADHGTYAARSPKYRVVRAIETHAARRAAQVTVICDGLKRDLVKRGIPAEKIAISWNGIDLSEFQMTTPDRAFASKWGLLGRRIAGFIGSFYGYEGLDLLVSAMALLRKRREDVCLLLLGGGPMEGALRSQVQSLGLEGTVILPGRVPHDQVPSLYGLIDILVYPRYSTRLTELVTPLKPLEAMAMGVPIVASDIGGHRELIQDGRTGLLVAPGDPTALAAAIELALGDSALRARLIELGRAYVAEKHPWEKTTLVYHGVYERALASRRGGAPMGPAGPSPEEP